MKVVGDRSEQTPSYGSISTAARTHFLESSDEKPRNVKEKMKACETRTNRIIRQVRDLAEKNRK